MLTLLSPAKINLFLRVISKCTDGYHNISSVFQTISLSDTLTVEAHSEDFLTCSNSQIPVDESNLVIKAVKLFRNKTGFDQFFKIHLEKKIPIQAGLGGGSSNAATTLWACNQLAKTNISIETLQQWGSEIGSDVPFFFSQGRAYCSGRGEIVQPLPPSCSNPFWIIKPPYGLSTPEVYRRLKLSGEKREFSLQGPIIYFNDLEQPAFEIRPDLGRLKRELQEMGFETVLMSGSGSSFFCMGAIDPPKNSQLTFFPVKFIYRPQDIWYTT